MRSILRILLSTFAVLLLAAATGDSAFAQKKKNPAFAKVTDDPDLPRVLLIGDSISIGYTVAAREALKGKANVHRVPGNAGHTGMGIAGLPKWLDEENGKWDVIHFNWGLWDLCYRNPESKTQGRRDKVNGKITHSVDEYVANLEKIVVELKKTGARLIFATTTPVPEEEAGRKVGDDKTYNAAAISVMKEHGIEINDLHAVMAGKMEKYGVKPGDVHFKPEGSELLGKMVAAAVLKQLPPPNPGKPKDGGTVLFDGKDFDHWLLAEGSWEIEEDGSMVCRMQDVEDKKSGKKKARPMGDIWSRKEYGDFELTVSYKLTEGANSGVFYRSNMNNKVQGGFEIQLMDNVGFQKTHGKKDARKLNGSFYDCLAPKSDPQNPIGEWNTLTLTCKGPMIACSINGTETFSVNVDDWNTPGKNPDGTTNKFKTAMKDLPRKGRIGFQNHGQVVWFKDVTIREL
ncbi:MAG: DUF1080 domain-containing protein [Verrucomicrobiales bacterium]|nr:DUF1080 domain-containing protein [Verrucomicrobiales bacterium]